MGIDTNGEHEAHLYSVRDPKNAGILYLAVNSYGIQYSSTEVYRLDLNTGKTDSIYKTDSQDTEYSLEGLQDNKLIFFKKDLSDSPGACFNGWTYAYEHPMPRSADEIVEGHDDYRIFQSLDLDNIESGLSYFPVPEEKYEIELEIEKECSEEFDKQN